MRNPHRDKLRNLFYHKARFQSNEIKDEKICIMYYETVEKT